MEKTKKPTKAQIKAWDNTVAIVLDISALDPAYFVVRNDADVLTA